MLIVLIALAVAALPFGMGAMMSAQAGTHHGHADMSGPAGMHSQHHLVPDSALPRAGYGISADGKQDHGNPAEGGAHVHFAACGSCASLPPVAIQALPEPAGQALPDVPAPAQLHSHATLPALPPPRV
jgi:hypothetical protein